MDNHIRPRASIPNREGFRFIGVLKDGSTRECVVTRDEKGLHHVEGFLELVGWMPLYPVV